jgi:hypothetical protein
MRAVRNTVDTGRTVVCTIHQPSIDVFEVTDAPTCASVGMASKIISFLPYWLMDGCSLQQCLQVC